MNQLRSTFGPTELSSGCQNLAQPVPLSNFVSDENSGCPHAAHTNVPCRFSSFKGLVNARSVPCFRRTPYSSRVSALCHSCSVFSTGNFSSVMTVVNVPGPASQATPGDRASVVPMIKKNCLRFTAYSRCSLDARRLAQVTPSHQFTPVRAQPSARGLIFRACRRHELPAFRGVIE